MTKELIMTINSNCRQNNLITITQVNINVSESIRFLKIKNSIIIKIIMEQLLTSYDFLLEYARL